MVMYVTLRMFVCNRIDKRCVDGVNIRVVIEMRQYLGRLCKVVQRRQYGDCDRDCDGDMKGHERSRKVTKGHERVMKGS